MKLYRREYSCMYKVRRVNPMDKYFVIGRPGKLRPAAGPARGPAAGAALVVMPRPRAPRGGRRPGGGGGGPTARLRHAPERGGRGRAPAGPGRRPCPLRGTMKRLRAAPKYTMGVRRSFPGRRIVAHL
jgi:hypothetical protein